VKVPYSVSQLLEWTGGNRISGSAATVFTGTSINTRTLAQGDLFVAIRGERHDAHEFIAQAIEAGAAGVLVERVWQADGAIPDSISVVAVDDTTRALGALAHGHRSEFEGPVVAITGSNGKTTTKEMCHGILSVAAPCLKNEGNLNNEFGLPLTLLSREDDHRAAVVEVGMNHRGEIARLASIAEPSVALITNVGTAHIEHLGSQDEIALEKGDLVEALEPQGVAVVNADDALALAQGARAPGRVITYGREKKADVMAEEVRFVSEGAFAFRLVTPVGTAALRVRGLAETSVINALAAAAAAMAAGAPIEQLAAGLERHDFVPGRMACRSLAVLGDMGELGEAADGAHRDAGRLAAELQTDFLFALGERSALVVEAAMEAGMPADHARVSRDHGQIARQLVDLLRHDDWVLVKGSRAMQMERVIEALDTYAQGEIA
jgi:UDP-N-acetylmuramoyl-tripeptide--D-alanyl-D-alanine ligase